MSVYSRNLRIYVSSTSKTPGYRPITSTSVRERAPAVEPDKGGSVRERYASRSFSSDRNKSPEPKAESGYKRYGSSAAYSPTSEAPSLRFGSSSRFGGQIARSPLSEKSPTVFGVSGYSRPTKEGEKAEPQQPASETMTVVTRGTSPTPPSSSSFLRARRAEMDRTLEKTVPRLRTRQTTHAVEVQTVEKCIEDAKLESKLSAASALTARTPSPSAYSRFNSGSTKYTPRTAAYHGNRPTELSLSRAGSVARTDEIKSVPSPTMEDKAKKLEGKDTTRIGGFSYARPTDLPLALNKELDGLKMVSPSKLRSTSPQTSSSSQGKPKTSFGKPTSESSDDSLTHSIKKDSTIPSGGSSGASPTPKVPLSPSRSVAKLTSPDRLKLPPPSPKNELAKTVLNKDFRKSELNMSVSSSSESSNLPKTFRTPEKTSSVERSPSIQSTGKLSTSKSLAKLPSSGSPSPNFARPVGKLTSPVVATKAQSSESSSEESSSGDSSTSSETETSESENEKPTRPLTSPVKSKTSVQLTSTEDTSKSLERPPRPPSSLRLNKPEDKRTDDAKAVVVRALAPVSGVMKVKYPGPSSDESERNGVSKGSDKLSNSATGKLDKSESKTSLGSGKKTYKIEHVQSGERAWWMGPPKEKTEKKSSDKSITSDSETNVKHNVVTNGANKVVTNNVSDKDQLSPPVSKLDKSGSISSISSEKKNFKVQHIQSGERAWWMGPPPEKSENKSDSEGKLSAKAENERLSNQGTAPPSPKGDGTKSTSASDNETKPPIPQRQYKLKVAESGSSSDIPGLEHSSSSANLRKDKNKSASYKLKRIDSGESLAQAQESEDNTSAGIQDVLSDTTSNKEADEGKAQQKPFRISRIESGDRAWWLGDSEDAKKSTSPKPPSPGLHNLAKTETSDNSRKTTSSSQDSSLLEKKAFKIMKIESGERAWWLGPEEAPKKRPPPPPPKRPKDAPLFIGRYTNIDDVLGTQAPPPAAFRTPQNSSDESDTDSEEMFEVKPCDVKIHDSTAMTPSISSGMIKLDDTALQLYKEGDYGSYLDLDASINEQQEEFDNFQANRKNSIVLRTQLSVRVHTIIEKLLSSEGRELRRALFSLKQIFQEDKDLVHEFVQNDGLACLIKVGSDADQNYQNYILRALGQVMLYVDGMSGVMEHVATVQWLYSLVSSRFRLVVKTALKLLLVFVEYVETNSVLLVKAIQVVDSAQGAPLWGNVMRLMKEYDAADTELLIYATSLVNKTLNGLPDQDTYYDQVDALEEQGFETIIRRYMSKQGTDLDLLRQFQIYEAVLQHEDGEQKGAPLKQLDETIRKTLRHRKCLTSTLNPLERRKSRRHSTGTSPHTLNTLNLARPNTEDPGSQTDEYHNMEESGVGVTPALRRRRERAERQRSFLREQREASLRASPSSTDQSASDDGGVHNGLCNGDSNRRENTVKDLTQKLASTLGSLPVLDADGKPVFGDMKGIITKAKEGLAKSQSRVDVLKSPTAESPPVIKPPEIKKSETELHWEELVNGCSRGLTLCDLDFTDLHSDDEQSVFAPASRAPGVPPPPPPLCVPPPCNIPPAAPPPLTNMAPRTASPVRKNKKTVKLFWKEVRDDPVVFSKLNSNTLIWDEMSPVPVDIQKLEHLFESRAKDLITKKQQEMNKNKEVIVLDPKRSNAINIGMTKLPPPRSIKTAILKMDATIMNREGIEKLLTMLPTEEERSKIQEAQAANPDLPLGSAEQFLLTLASISELPARLKLWAFKLDFENSEKEIAEPLMDLKQGIETLRSNKTFRGVLGTLLSIGIFLNGTEVKGFQIEYLAKVPEVKDTVHKHSLLHHLCHMVMDKFPDATDLYSEIGAVTRASKVDFDELSGNIVRLETECKASFDHLKVITKHDGSNMDNMKIKMSDFLVDCAEHIIVLSKVHKRVMNRYFKFCLWLGIPYHRVNATKPNELCRIVSEFALEYRTTRERVMQQLEKKASHRERNKTRGKMITEVGKFRSQDDRADAELKQLLGNDSADNESTLTGSLPWRRQRKDPGRVSLGNMRNDNTLNGILADADDEILESLVKTATKIPTSRAAPRERKRTRHADRKSLIKRSRTRDNVPAEGTESQS